MHLTILMACNHEDESLDEVEHDTENTQGSDYNDRLLLRSVSSVASRSKGESRASFYENSKVKSVRSIRGDSDKGPGMSLEKDTSGSLTEPNTPNTFAPRFSSPLLYNRRARKATDESFRRIWDHEWQH